MHRANSSSSSSSSNNNAGAGRSRQWYFRILLVAPLLLFMSWSHSLASTRVSPSQVRYDLSLDHYHLDHQAQPQAEHADSSSGSIICDHIPALTAEQRHLCHHAPEVLSVVRRGVQLAFAECHRLFWWMRDIHAVWNCTLYEANLAPNRFYLNITTPELQGTKESSLVHALVSAGVTYALSEACTRVEFAYCSCGKWFDSVPYRESITGEKPYLMPLIRQPGNASYATRATWEWNGCASNLDFGAEVARVFLDSPEYYKRSPYALINLHNNQVGREVLKDEVVNQCQCHGYSGSCTMRTCWRRMNSFTSVAQTIYARYVQARMVNYARLFQEFREHYDQLAEEISNADNDNNNNNNNNNNNSDSRHQQVLAKMRHLKEVQESTLNDPEHTIFHHTLFNQPNMLRSDHGEELLLAKISHMETHTIRNQDLIFVKQPSDHCRHLRVALEHNKVACLHTNNTTDNNNKTLDGDGNNNNNNQYPHNNNQMFNLPALKRAQRNKSNENHKDQLDLASQAGTCENLCCGRGFRQHVTYRTEPCDCKFEFCCRVRCRRKCKTPVVQYECL